jgi:predicted nucleotidyltransferase
MAPPDLESIRTLLSGNEIELGVLFGSAARGALRRDSDIDIGIVPGRRFSLDEELALGVALEETLGREVDLVRLDHASTLLRFQASRGRCLHQGRPGAFSDFVARALLEYEDLKPILRRCAGGMFRRLREGA